MESSWAREVDISPRQLEEYLRLRGKFLEAVIKADLDNLPQFSLPEPLIAQRDATHSTEENIELAPPGKQYQRTDAGHDGSVENLLYAMIEKRTGFPSHTLSPELRLLDDLNLDSIKAGDLLAEIAIQLKIAGDFDVAQYANATLREITEAFGGGRSGQTADRDTASFRETAWDAEAILAVVVQNAAKLLGRSVETVKAEALLGADLNLSLEHCGKLIHLIADELETELNVDLPPLLDRSLAQIAEIVKRILYHRQARQAPPPSIAHRPWVREIHGELVETPASLSGKHQGRRHEDKWQHAKVLILGSEITGSVATELKGYLISLGAEVTLHELHKELEPDSVKKAAAYSHLILLLPQEGWRIGCG